MAGPRRSPSQSSATMVRAQVQARLLRRCLWVLLAASGVAALPGYAVDYHAYPKYSFKYGVSDVHTGDVKQHSEEREGDVVRGQYSLVEPDGSVRQVEYTADPVNGFNAVVLKSKPSVHPVAAKPIAVATPPAAVQKPLPLAVAAPVNYFPTAPLHYGHEDLAAAAPFGGPQFPYAADQEPYGAYLHGYAQY